MLVHATFEVPDELSLFDELVTFASSAAAWEISFLNESDSGDIMDMEEAHLSWLPNASSYGTDYSMVGGASDYLEASKYSSSSVGMSLDIFLLLLSPPFSILKEL